MKVGPPLRDAIRFFDEASGWAKAPQLVFLTSWYYGIFALTIQGAGWLC